MTTMPWEKAPCNKESLWRFSRIFEKAKDMYVKKDKDSVVISAEGNIILILTMGQRREERVGWSEGGRHLPISGSLHITLNAPADRQLIKDLSEEGRRSLVAQLVKAIQSTDLFVRTKNKLYYGTKVSNPVRCFQNGERIRW